MRVETALRPADETFDERPLRPVPFPAGEAGAEPRSRPSGHQHLGARGPALRRSRVAFQRRERRPRRGRGRPLRPRVRVQGLRLAPPLRSARAPATADSRRSLRGGERHRCRTARTLRRCRARCSRPQGDKRPCRSRAGVSLPLHARPDRHGGADAACRDGRRDHGRFRCRPCRSRNRGPGRLRRCGRHRRAPATDRERAVDPLPHRALARREAHPAPERMAGVGTRPGLVAHAGVRPLPLLQALGFALSLPVAIAFLCAAAASGALPIAPAGAATQAGAGAAILIASGVGTANAISFAVGAQALLILAGASVLVFAALWHGGRRLALAVL